MITPVLLQETTKSGPVRNSIHGLYKLIGLQDRRPRLSLHLHSLNTNKVQSSTPIHAERKKRRKKRGEEKSSGTLVGCCLDELLVALIRGCNATIPYFCFSIRKLKSRSAYESVASLQCLRSMCINPSSNVESDTEMAKVTRERCNLDAGKGSCGYCGSASLVSLGLTKSVELDSGNRELIPLRRNFL